MLTIFTPTKNRGYIIHKCYESLCRQSNNDFIWLVVDDGSNDNTEEVINSFISERKIEIVFLRQKNGGKHVAHNTGVLNCKTDIFVCVDSDDYLSDNAVQVIYDNWKEVAEDDSLAGILALKGEILNKSSRSCLPKNIERTSIMDLYEKYNFIGETILVFKTSILKQYLFPVFEGEKFVTEAVVYDQISRKYKMKLLNKILYLYEYLDDGYSKNILSFYRENPKGYMFFYKQRIELAKGFKENYNAVSRYIAAFLTIKDITSFRNCEYKFLGIICIPNGVWIYLKPIIKKQLIKYKLMKDIKS
ncbi:glycosyltransferase family 2 protein [Candidatus Pristimantibacillus sp. PTI5]|uniref:glycosyltransferase family 2 protein n=1 Tax=Candidatus Pristimantibacillus sp. PTI5 TaxID=3400422 RepID=UPI003B016573